MVRRILRWAAKPVRDKILGWVDAARPPPPPPAVVPAPSPTPPRIALNILEGSDSGRFLEHSVCNAVDMLHPRYAEICAMLCETPRWHRKQWEWVYIAHKLMHAGVVAPGKRGIVFGVGSERLPSLFAKMGAGITATDAPPDSNAASEWTAGNQYSSGRDNLYYPEIVDRPTFDKRVQFQPCDMTAIDPALTGYDFNWSSCCFEHLGTLQAGMDFVVDAVEKTLKVGGVAVHTTEFNLSSDDETVTEGGTVIYRKRDILRLIDTLRSRGHEVADLVVGPHTHPLDHYIDMPPYSQDPHLKLALLGFVSTSVGLVIRRRL